LIVWGGNMTVEFPDGKREFVMYGFQRKGIFFGVMIAYKV